MGDIIAKVGNQPDQVVGGYSLDEHNDRVDKVVGWVKSHDTVVGNISSSSAFRAIMAHCSR